MLKIGHILLGLHMIDIIVLSQNRTKQSSPLPSDESEAHKLYSCNNLYFMNKMRLNYAINCVDAETALLFILIRNVSLFSASSYWMLANLIKEYRPILKDSEIEQCYKIAHNCGTINPIKPTKFCYLGWQCTCIMVDVLGNLMNRYTTVTNYRLSNVNSFDSVGA